MSKKRIGNFQVPKDPPNEPSLLAIGILLVIVPPITTVIGLYLGYKRFRNALNRQRYQLYRRYANAIGNRTEVSIRSLAASMGLPTPNVVKDLQTMIDEGMILGDAYIDHNHMMLYMKPATVETDFVENVVNPVINLFVNPEANVSASSEAKSAQSASVETIVVEKSVAEAPEKMRSVSQSVKPGSDNDNFEAKLREIRQLNDSIKDVAVSERIDRIGELTASIFRVVQEKPEHEEEVRKFMNYYLPTTLKLLKSYSLMEKQSYQGENIQSSRKKIENVLDTLILGFEQQQDRLFRTEALDVEADISVLETMMASDGLLDKRDNLRTGGGVG